jgi:hypothetical protein
MARWHAVAADWCVILKNIWLAAEHMMWVQGSCLYIYTAINTPVQQTISERTSSQQSSHIGCLSN